MLGHRPLQLPGGLPSGKLLTTGWEHRPVTVLEKGVLVRDRPPPPDIGMPHSGYGHEPASQVLI
jgi:hypothetical protein